MHPCTLCLPAPPNGGCLHQGAGLTRHHGAGLVPRQPALLQHWARQAHGGQPADALLSPKLAQLASCILCWHYIICSLSLVNH